MTKILSQFSYSFRITFRRLKQDPEKLTRLILNGIWKATVTILPVIITLFVNNSRIRYIIIGLVLITVLASPIINNIIAGYKGQKMIDRYCNLEYLLSSTFAYVYRAKRREKYNRLEIQKLKVAYHLTEIDGDKEHCRFRVVYQLTGRNRFDETVNEIEIITSSGVNTIYKNITLTAVDEKSTLELVTKAGKEYHPLKYFKILLGNGIKHGEEFDLKLELKWNAGIPAQEDANVYIFDPENFSEYVDSVDIEIFNETELFKRHLVKFDILNMENFDIRMVKNQSSLDCGAAYKNIKPKHNMMYLTRLIQPDKD